MTLKIGFGKKHAFLALGAGAAVFGAVLMRDLPPGSLDARNGVPASGAMPTVTLDGYRAAASQAMRGFAVGDAPSADSAFSKLVALRVPKEGMKSHEDLVIALAAYREALASGDRSAAALSRLRESAGANPWLGLSF